MTLAILVFNFYPVTAVMIVMIALLNDGAILSIAYDNVLYRNKPESWNMRLVLSISTVLGVIGVAAAFLLFYLGERVFHMDRLTVQTLMYLKLSVAGHLTIFLTRTRGPFWSIRPAKILLIAVVGTQTIATLLAVYGVFMTPLGWKWAGFVWAYAIVWALINDRIKLLAYKIFDPVKAAPKPDAKAEPPAPEAKPDQPKPDAPKPDAKADEPKPDAKADQPKPEAKTDEPKPDAKTDAPTPKAKADEPKPDAKAEPKPDAKPDAPAPDAKTEPTNKAKAEPRPETKTTSDSTPQVAKRAYEIYEKRAGNDGTAVQDWKKAEQEIRNDDAKAEPKPGAKAEPEPDTKADTPAPDAKADEPKPEAKDKTPSDVSPQLVKRVHQLYEQLGREDVQAVQDLEKAEPNLRPMKRANKQT
jgi:H+-transporting ATPase